MLHKTVLLIFATLGLLTSSCNSNKNLRDLNEFNFQKDALKNHEKVIVLCSSENPENGDEDYLIHMIVQSLKTGDTINVLFPGVREIYGEDIKSFISPNDIFFNVDENSKDYKSMTKVYSNPEFITFNWKKYPSIIGKVSTIYDSNEKPVEELIEQTLDKITEQN